MQLVSLGRKGEISYLIALMLPTTQHNVKHNPFSTVDYKNINLDLESQGELQVRELLHGILHRMLVLGLTRGTKMLGLVEEKEEWLYLY